MESDEIIVLIMIYKLHHRYFILVHKVPPLWKNMFYLVALKLVCNFMVQFERTEGGQPLVTPYLTKDWPFEVTLFCLESLSRIDSEQHPEEIIGTFETGQLKRIVGLENYCRMMSLLTKARHYEFPGHAP
ncbi:hypothetical protein TNCV_3064441 [Trichonephila clavipes]|nr:hypothetical protein TNCV_3064441 [Trichonephila clavipes]